MRGEYCGGGNNCAGVSSVSPPWGWEGGIMWEGGNNVGRWGNNKGGLKTTTYSRRPLPGRLNFEIRSRVETDSGFYYLCGKANVTSRVFTRKTAPPPLAAMFLDRSGPFFNSSEILIKPMFSQCFMMIGEKRKCANPPPGSHETNALTKFHENCAKNVTSRVFSCFHYIHIEKTAPPNGRHVFSPIWTIFELVRDIDKTNVLTKKTAPPPWQPCFSTDQNHFLT
ncbi:hypothetical protein DPMN_070156 [Dreissena polymorpha]|uniref:Uncharacterized protein n=1 Tax=Dreissena polymorpha TaxID=45954 RepID=A0A9D3Z4V9_DREPO|nr:hypothetical protein DPMN_070156 [Dreissena polymorpha]